MVGQEMVRGCEVRVVPGRRRVVLRRCLCDAYWRLRGRADYPEDSYGGEYDS